MALVILISDIGGGYQLGVSITIEKVKCKGKTVKIW